MEILPITSMNNYQLSLIVDTGVCLLGISKPMASAY